MNVIMGTIAILIAFNGQSSNIPLQGENSILPNLIPQTFMVTFMTVLVSTLVTRRKQRLHALPQVDHPAMKKPFHVLLLAGGSALVMALLLTPAWYVVLPMVTPPLWEKFYLLTFTTSYSIILSIIITPLALLRAMNESTQLIPAH